MPQKFEVNDKAKLNANRPAYTKEQGLRVGRVGEVVSKEWDESAQHIIYKVRFARPSNDPKITRTKHIVTHLRSNALDRLN